MKNLILIIAISLLPVTSNAQCLPMEYEELADMDLTELAEKSAEYNAIMIETMQLARSYINADMLSSAQAYANAAQKCSNELARIDKVILRKQKKAQKAK